MATLNMGISYNLTYDEIDRLVLENSIGNYAYGYLNDKGVFIVCYVGRSDTDLKERIKHGIEDMKADPTCRYERLNSATLIQYRKHTRRSAKITTTLVGWKDICVTKYIQPSQKVIRDPARFVENSNT